MKVAPGYLLLLINPSNLSTIEFHLSAQSASLSRRYDVEKIIDFPIFYFASKVWEKSFPTSCRTSLYDKNSRFWLSLKFLQKITFSSKCIKMHEIWSNWHFFATLRGATEARFCRIELGRGSKFQERPILFVQNKIKVFANFCNGRRMSNVSCENGNFDIFDGFLNNNKHLGAMMMYKNHDFF